MPDVGEGLTEAEILSWYVQPGDTVTDGQVVCEVETAKAAVELPIPYDGTVHELRFPAGTTVDVGQVIISVDTGGGTAAAEEAGETGDAGETAETGQAPKGRQPVLVGYGVAESSTRRRPRKQTAAGSAQAPSAPGSAQAAPASAPASVPAPVPVAVPVPEQSVPERGVAERVVPNGGSGLNGHGPAAPAAAPDVPTAGGRPLAKPPVRKLAKDLGVDLATVVPSGPDGIITREDVHAAAAPAPAPEPEVAADLPVTAGAAVTAGARETRVPVKGVRKATAQAMVGSAFTAPHVTEFITVDVTRTMKLIDGLKSDPDLAGVRINPLLMIARALLLAIRRNPGINASWDEARQEIVLKHYVNLGIAAATPRGLLVPNIKDAHTRTLPELAGDLAELVTTAREGRTTPAAMQGGTVTITNVGVFGIDTGTPILNPGEAAILAVGAIGLRPWVHKGKVKPRQVTTLALSFDHRLVDGELGSRVLADTAAVLEQPKRLITWT
ncbi:2-oxo acid dehydrogenase subunit E2 [Streptomyces clavuligerus]|uniref:dihydrolipoamide acetyltransferase family protein n=1 Tax=Streptomyces clavuligerus TaxID=1901 RepID=UPI0018CA34A6|nr:dihydrolipoamide acetyltransferase family protein [Streptomyces clavuligerus]QPL66574.1 2-oxo acid dehydrogenase subunit E2 [Streptomyces clavuligerus]QPL72607.1 2-oxo acid dehydrogenase subunit E2 [Streptomyces clavuligerus]QPL78684.1 2-oxo acid dehydrogenase subunit E2 [Streptomyces clavuligerus]QPL84711.1 2-oxo acid dehydrogenase subunit E2 [Streptomyces clavuligerus]QPL90881.1 2-oxo acid dehydrogenase subunit E2 [Streptomyces clavuligerus]